MKYNGLLKIQNISRSTKRLTTHAKRYAADEGGILTMREQWLREGYERLSKESKNRFSDYDRLAFLHSSIGDILQIAFGNTRACKTHLYQCALYKSYACCYFGLQNLGSKCGANLRELAYFEAAVIADADEVAHTLGDQLIAADQGPMPISVKKIESSLIDLFNGNDLRVKENCDFIKANQDTLWTGTSIFDTIELYEAILTQDNQKFYDLFVASLRKNRRDPNLVYFLDFLHITIGKIALERGFELPIDTADCPQCLLQSEVSDYSSVEIKKPIEGLPFLIK